MGKQMRLRFGLSSLLLLTVFVSLLCAACLYLLGVYYAERRSIEKELREVDGITYQIAGYEDVVEEVAEVSISIDEVPGSVIQLAGAGSYGATGVFHLKRLGKWRFVVSGMTKAGRNEITGEPVDSRYLGAAIALGKDSPYQNLIPFRLATLPDLIARYQDFEKLLETWPRQTSPGKVVLDDGTVQEFYVIEDSPKRK